MARFALKKIDAVQGIQSFEKLLVDGTAPFDSFESGLESKDKRSLKQRVKEYEFKDGALRVYAIAKPEGKIIVMGGYKNRQKKDFKKFRSLKERYLEQEMENT